MITFRLVAMAFAFVAALPLTGAYDKSYWCFLETRFNIARHPTRAQVVWAIAESIRTYRQVYRFVGDQKFVLQSASLQWYGSAVIPPNRHLEEEDPDDGDDKKARRKKNKNKNKKRKRRQSQMFDLKHMNLDDLLDFHRFDDPGLNMTNYIDEDEDFEEYSEDEEDFDDRRVLRGKTAKDQADNQGQTNRQLQGRGVNLGGSTKGNIKCDNCQDFKYSITTTTHGGNTPQYLNRRWEDGWCENLRQKARRNSDFRVFESVRNCFVYLSGCRDGFTGYGYRRLEEVDTSETNSTSHELNEIIPDVPVFETKSDPSPKSESSSVDMIVGESA